MKAVDIYQCAYYEYEYDDLGKYSWCHRKSARKPKCFSLGRNCARWSLNNEIGH